jgi:hypothetical protein
LLVSANTVFVLCSASGSSSGFWGSEGHVGDCGAVPGPVLGAGGPVLGGRLELSRARHAHHGVGDDLRHLRILREARAFGLGDRRSERVEGAELARDTTTGAADLAHHRRSLASLDRGPCPRAGGRRQEGPVLVAQKHDHATGRPLAVTCDPPC